MKKIFWLMVIVFAVSCKKDGSGSGSSNALLSKAFREGLLEREYIYDTDRKLVRLNSYLAGGGVSNLSIYYLYEYDDDGRLSEVRHFSKDHSPTTRRVFSYSAAGKVSRVDEATIFTGSDDLDVMDYFEVYDYNAAGQLTKMTRRLTNYTLHRYTDYTYDDKGYLASEEDWYREDNGDIVLKQKTEINPGSKPIPDHWKTLLTTPTDFSFYYLFIPGMKYTSYWLGPANVSDWTFINRQQNNKGFVEKQTLSIKYEDGSTGSSDYSYEYIQ
jgi:hypothetical protein